MLHKGISLIMGAFLLPALGLALVGEYVQASLVLCAVVAIPRGVQWLLRRGWRRA
jgi:hypothetical protein